MILTMGEPQIRSLLHRQVSSLYPLVEGDVEAVDAALPAALARAERCFSRVRNKYYSEGGSVRFDPMHGCQWAAFLYLLSNEIWRSGGGAVCDKLYAVSKALSGADLFYQVGLPEVFFFDHPVGSVAGRATYSDYFSFGQGCTVGNNHGAYPEFGESVFMMSDSKVIGACRIGDFVIIGANSYIKDREIPSGSLVFGQEPDVILKHRPDYVREYAEGVFRYE